MRNQVELACVLLPGIRTLCFSDEVSQPDAPLPELKTLSLTFQDQALQASSLPASLTSIPLNCCRFPLDDALPASLRRLELMGNAHRLTATSFSGCPQLRTLDLRWARIAEIPVGCLPPTLTSLLLPRDLWPKGHCW